MAEPITASTRPVPANTSISINPPPTINISPVNLTPQQLINNITTPLVSVSQPSTTTPTTVISSQGQPQPTEPPVEPSNLEVCWDCNRVSNPTLQNYPNCTFLKLGPDMNSNVKV